jgi:hypothetical protein
MQTELGYTICLILILPETRNKIWEARFEGGFPSLSSFWARYFRFSNLSLAFRFLAGKTARNPRRSNTKRRIGGFHLRARYPADNAVAGSFVGPVGAFMSMAVEVSLKA